MSGTGTAITRKSAAAPVPFNVYGLAVAARALTSANSSAFGSGLSLVVLV
ncbi:hypothetical protein [Paractinoplanes durhamensis]